MRAKWATSECTGDKYSFDADDHFETHRSWKQADPAIAA
jgi:hypothetical protein